MELVFQENPLSYLNRILCERVTQEQTAELIVPDSCSDAQRIVDAFGTVLIRAEECMAGSISVAGAVQAGVLFVTEEGQVECLHTQIPFSIRQELPDRQEECTMQCACSLRSVDARLLNSRKVLIRAGISCDLQVYAQRQCMVADLEAPASSLQLRRVELPLQMPLALGERSFVLNEELELPAGKPPVERLLRVLYRPQVQEQKAVGSKAVFKGGLTVHVLYEDGEGSLQAFESDLPFSQYTELDSEPEEGQVQTLLTMTSAETEPETQHDCRRLLLSVNLLAQCVVFGERRVKLISDAYCTDAALEPRYNQWEMTGILDRQSFRDTALASADVPAKRVVDAWMYPDEPIRQRSGERVSMELPLNCSVLYYDADGALQGKLLRPVMNAETMLAEKGSCRISQVSGGEIFCAAGPGGLELRCPVSMEMESYAQEQLRALSGGEITPEETAAQRPSVLLRRTTQPQEVWEIAKSCRAVPEAILQANELQETLIPADIMLLIPM